MRDICPICSSKRHKAINKRIFSNMQNIVPFNSYVVKQCSCCGMVYAGDIVEVMSLDKYYDKMSKYDNDDYFLSTESKIINDKNIDFIKNYIDKNDNILEIGCAMGNLLYQLKIRGYKNITGIEPSKNNVAGIKSRWGIKCYAGTLGGDDILEIAGNKYKMIIMHMVLEHLLSLHEVIEQIVEYIEDNGYLFLGVPDINDWGNLTDLYQQFSVEHVNYFSLQSLSNLLGLHGFRCVKYEVDGIGNSHSIWQYTGKKKELTFANDGCAAIKQYLINAQDLVNKIKEKLSHYRGKRLYLWGAGTHTAALYQLGLLDDISVQGIIDYNKNYHGKTIFGLQVISPRELLSMEKLPIIISSQLAQKSIKKQITEMCGNEVVELY